MSPPVLVGKAVKNIYPLPLEEKVYTLDIENQKYIPVIARNHRLPWPSYGCDRVYRVPED
jgi:hypothetical protein